MKLRIKGNSIRLRLTRPEVEKFGTEGYLEAQTEVGDTLFVYALQQYDGSNLSAAMQHNKMTVYMPAAFAREWTATEKVGYEYEKELATGKKLYLLIEKDFKCLDENVQEDQSDNYDHPIIPKQ